MQTFNLHFRTPFKEITQTVTASSYANAKHKATIIAITLELGNHCLSISKQDES